MSNPIPTRRFPTPAWLIYGLLVVEALLWLSERLGWPAWHKGYAVLASVAAVGAAMLVMLAWFVVSLAFRRRFQFSIRSLLVLTVAVALPCSWLGVEMKAAKGQKDTVDAIKQLGGSVGYDWEFDPNPFVMLDKLLDEYDHPRPRPWLWKLLGDDFFAEVYTVRFYGATVTDDGLEYLRGVTQLRQLSFAFTQLTDAGLEFLRGLSQLNELELSGSKVTAEGVKRLLPRLTSVVPALPIVWPKMAMRV